MPGYLPPRHVGCIHSRHDREHSRNVTFAFRPSLTQVPFILDLSAVLAVIWLSSSEARALLNWRTAAAAQALTLRQNDVH